jgi:glyoxylase-like metal-dependent hydrolase (beta-lactamase superfamily II)
MLRKYPATVLTAFAVAIIVMCGAGAKSPISRETRLSDRVLILYHAPWNETMTAIDAGPSLIVVDAWGSLAAAREARVRIEGIFHKRVGYVVNTHHHWGHTFGNAAFADAVIVGHEFCPQDMKDDYADAAKRKAYFIKSAVDISAVAAVAA